MSFLRNVRFYFDSALLNRLAIEIFLKFVYLFLIGDSNLSIYSVLDLLDYYLCRLLVTSQAVNRVHMQKLEVLLKKS